MIKNALWLFSITVVILIFFLPSFAQIHDLRRKNAAYKREIQELKEQQLRLTEEKRRLEDDPVYLEKVAREKMGLLREGEVIYRILPANRAE